MPGFMVAPDVGEGLSTSNLLPVYNYTWKIASLFEDISGTNTIIAKDMTLPTFTITKETVEGSSLMYKYAGMVNWEDVKITFYDVVIGTNKLSTLLQKWRNRVWSPKFGLRSATDYKKDSKIEVYTLDWEIKSVWTLHGSWPQTVKEGDLTYTSTDIKVVDVIIAYDWAVLDESPGSYTTSDGVEVTNRHPDIPVQPLGSGVG